MVASQHFAATGAKRFGRFRQLLFAQLQNSIGVKAIGRGWQHRDFQKGTSKRGLAEEDRQKTRGFCTSIRCILPALVAGGVSSQLSANPRGACPPSKWRPFVVRRSVWPLLVDPFPVHAVGYLIDRGAVLVLFLCCHRRVTARGFGSRGQAAINVAWTVDHQGNLLYAVLANSNSTLDSN